MRMARIFLWLLIICNYIGFKVGLAWMDSISRGLAVVLAIVVMRNLFLAFFRKEGEWKLGFFVENGCILVASLLFLFL